MCVLVELLVQDPDIAQEEAQDQLHNGGSHYPPVTLS